MRAQKIKALNDSIRDNAAKRQEIHDLFNRSCRMEEVYPDAFKDGTALMGYTTSNEVAYEKDGGVVEGFFLDAKGKKIHTISAADYNYIKTGERK